MRRVGLKSKLAIVALVLGVLALFGDPYRGGVVAVDTRELARIVETRQDHVSAAELADWIVADRLRARLQIQQHKYIWSPEARGV